MQYHEALVPALIGALSGYACSMVLTGTGVKPVWSIPAVGSIHPVDFLWAIGAGVGGALVAIAFTYLVLGMRRVFRLGPASARPVVGGLALALLALWSPYALTFGEQQTALRVAAPARGERADRRGASRSCSARRSRSRRAGRAASSSRCSSWVPRSASSRTTAFVDAHAGVLIAALMVAANVGVTKTMLGSTLVVTEMGGMRLLPTTLLAALVAMMLTSSVGLIDSQRERTPMDPTEEAEPA